MRCFLPMFTTQDVSEISFSELTQLVAGFLLDSNPPHEDSRISVNQQTQVNGLARGAYREIFSVGA